MLLAIKYVTTQNTMTEFNRAPLLRSLLLQAAIRNLTLAHLHTKGWLEVGQTAIPHSEPAAGRYTEQSEKGRWSGGEKHDMRNNLIYFIFEGASKTLRSGAEERSMR